jgi:hypothetical protein
MRKRVAVLLPLLLPTSVLASNGLLEINQTCAVETGCLEGDTPGFPVTISTPGSYVLTSSLEVPPDSSGISIETNDVSVHLNGFAINGQVPCPAKLGPVSELASSGGDRRRDEAEAIF